MVWDQVLAGRGVGYENLGVSVDEKPFRGGMTSRTEICAHLSDFG